MSQLTASKTPGIIVSEIKMMSSSFRGIHFLVEGDDDSKFWKLRVSRVGTSIVSCEGKSNLLGASALINRLALPNIAGVYDPDFERLFGVSHFPNLLAPTDENDLELTMIVSEALEKLLHEYGDESLISAFQSARGISTHDYIEQLSREFGKLRLLSASLRHRVDFDRLSPYRFISEVDWSLNLQGLHIEYARLAGTTIAQLAADLAANVPTAGLWGLSQGHDAVRILALGLKRTIGRKQISDQDVARVLRIGYSIEVLQRSQMYKSLRTIEATFTTPIF